MVSDINFIEGPNLWPSWDPLWAFYYISKITGIFFDGPFIYLKTIKSLVKQGFWLYPGREPRFEQLLSYALFTKGSA